MTNDVPDPIRLRQPGAVRILARCMGYLRPYWKYSAAAYVLLLINSGISLAQPLIIRTIVDDGISGRQANVIQSSTLLLFGVTLAKGLFTFLYGRWSEVASQNVAYDLRNAIHKKLQSLSFSYHDQAETGQLLTRAISDVDRVRFLAGRALITLSQLVILIVSIAIAMLIMNVRLALATLIIVPFLAVTAVDFGRRFRPVFRTIQHQLSALTSRLEQNLRGARIVAAFAQEGAELERLNDENARLLNLYLSAGRLRAIYLPMLSLIASVGTISVLLYGGQEVISGRLSIGALIAFTAYVTQLLMPTRRLGMIISAISQAAASGTRIFEILDAKSEVEDLPGASPLGRVMGRVEFKNVSFAYFGRHRVLSGIDLEAKPGDLVALLGATGSGKSSVINLIPRFYDVTEGRILLDGHDIRDVTVDSLRDQIGIVMQDTRLFAASVRENISFGRPDATEEEILAAAKAAHAHEFIVQMADGYDTWVGERGTTLSGGQKQRISIARAILKDPRILILDDATSSVDTGTEALIQQALATLMRGRTSFVIAQRLSTIRQADQVLVLEGGKVAAHGTRNDEHSAHDHLLRTSGLYAEIYHRQLRPQERLVAQEA